MNGAAAAFAAVATAILWLLPALQRAAAVVREQDAAGNVDIGRGVDVLQRFSIIGDVLFGDVSNTREQVTHHILDGADRFTEILNVTKNYTNLLNVTFCPDVDCLFDVYFEGFRVDLSEKPWKLLTTSRSRLLTSERFGIPDMAMGFGQKFVIVSFRRPVKRIKTSNNFTQLVELKSEIAEKFKCMSVGVESMVTNFIKEHGSHYIDEYTVGDVVFQVSLNPVRILKHQAEEDKGENARLSSFIGAIAIGDLVKSTLGPKGMDKILISAGRGGMDAKVEVTNDGATILKNIGVDNPAAKILVDMSKVQDGEVGDGTTSVTVLAAELLREAEKLVDQKIHPQVIVSGWRKATKIAHEALQAASMNHSENDDKFREDLLNIARTTLSSKILSQHKEHFAKLSVDAILRLKGSGNLSAIQIIKLKGGCLEDSFLDDGFLLDKKIGQHQPKHIENARILIANTPMDTDKIKVFGSRIKVDSMAKVADLELAEKEKMKDKVGKILAHECNVFINRQLIYNYPEQLFADSGIMAIEHADFDGIERLALVTGGEILSTFDSPATAKLGTCKLIEEVMIGESTLLRFSGVALGEACTIVIRGATEQIIDEADRSLHDALCVLSSTVREPTIVFGGGSSEMLMANAVSVVAAKTAGKEAVAMEAFARALQSLPTTIADNAGLDSAQLISELKAAHALGKTTMGLDMENGKLGCMKDIGITESFVVKRQVLVSAAEAAEMILRVDCIIKAAPRQRVEDRGHC